MSKFKVEDELLQALNRDLREFTEAVSQFVVYTTTRPSPPKPQVISQYLSDSEMIRICFHIERIRSFAWYITGSKVNKRIGLTEAENARYGELKNFLRNYRAAGVPSFIEFLGAYYRRTQHSI